ncbi:MAG: hypothetical protein ACXWZT_11230 [Gaiellaceae bacterium]
MKHFRAPTILVGGLAVVALLAGNAVANTAVFNGRYTGTTTEKVNGQKITAVARGKGTATLIGKSTITGTVVATTSSDQPCAPFTGPGVIAGKVGKLKVTVVPTSRGCAAGEDDRDNISLAGTVKVRGGTLKFRTAHGTLRFTGHYNRASGAFNVKLKGTLKF